MMLSIVVPMYNLENCIQDTLKSILHNDLTECELILLDDGSDDRTIEVADIYLEQNCSCFYRIIRKSNTGVSDTRNQGIMAASGKYILFCDGDDLLEPDLISVVREQQNEDTDMMAWPYYIINNDSKMLSQKSGKTEKYSSEQMMRLHLHKGYRIRMGSFIIKRERLLKEQLFFARDCSFAEDMEFIMKCILVSDTIQWIDAPLFCYRKREGSLMTSYDLRKFEAPRAIERVADYIETKQFLLSDDLKEYIENGLFILHYIYSIESCLLGVKSLKDTRKLWNSITEKYNDVETKCRKKIKRMQKSPYMVSKKRVCFLKISTSFYIVVRFLTNCVRRK